MLHFGCLVNKTKRKIIESLRRLYKATGEPVSTRVLAWRVGISPGRLSVITRNDPSIANSTSIRGLGSELMYTPKTREDNNAK